jgi:Uncharacterized protein conserved in bacteria (DUF2188)
MANKSIYTRKLGEIIAREAKNIISGRYHVIPILSDKWALVSNGSIKPIRAFDTQREAISFAQKISTTKSAIEVAIHGKDGRIKESIPLM